jgi:hypothetical protein
MLKRAGHHRLVLNACCTRAELCRITQRLPSPNGGNWHVYGDDKSNTFDYTQQGYRLGLGGEWRVIGPCWLNVEAGRQFAQQLEFDNEQGFRETLELDDSSYLHLSARLRFN